MDDWHKRQHRTSSTQQPEPAQANKPKEKETASLETVADLEKNIRWKSGNMAKFVRSSKFRHVFGSPWRKDEVYDNIPVTRSAWDSNFCDVNEKFVAVILESGGGGAFLVLRHDQKGKQQEPGKVVGHKGPVLDIQWNPYNANMIASGSDDCTVKVWLIPDEGLEKGKDMDTAALVLEGHGRKVGQVLWHPTAQNILFSASADLTIRVWDVGTGKEVNCINGHTDTIYSMSFNLDGSKFCTTSKDKKIRVFDSHTGELLKEADCHEGAKPTRCVWLADTGRILTTGFSKTQERQYILFNAEDLSQLKVENIDTSSGVLMPFYDNDLKLLYLAGKGDGNIRYFEITDDAPYVHYLSEYKSSDPQRGMGYLPKRACEVSKCEIARFYKLHAKNIVEPICMIVPRKSDSFQEDIFPDAIGDQPALTAEEWLKGRNANPKTISLRDGFVATTKEFVAPVFETKAADVAAPTSAKEYEEGYHKLQAEVQRLQNELATKDIEIRRLELEIKKAKGEETAE